MSNMISPIEYEQTAAAGKGCPGGLRSPQQLTLLFTLDAQGPTSSGKTSLVEYLARRTGHTCVARHPSFSSLGSALGQPTTAAMTCQMFF